MGTIATTIVRCSTCYGVLNGSLQHTGDYLCKCTLKPLIQISMKSKEEILKILNPCLHCGNKDLKVYHQDYNGDCYVGDEYSIDCHCGISTGWFNAEKLVSIWNKKHDFQSDASSEEIRKWGKGCTVCGINEVVTNGHCNCCGAKQISYATP